MSLSRTTHTLPGLVVPVDELLSNSARVAEARESKHMRAICVRHGHRARPGTTPRAAGLGGGYSRRVIYGNSSSRWRWPSHPPPAITPSHGRDHGTGRGREPQSTSLPARTRARRSVETTVPRERAFVVVPDSILQGTMLGCPASTSGVGRNSTARPRADRRRACPTSGCGRRGEVIECDGRSRGGRSHASGCWGAKGCGAQARRALL